MTHPVTRNGVTRDAAPLPCMCVTTVTGYFCAHKHLREIEEIKVAISRGFKCAFLQLFAARML